MPDSASGISSPALNSRKRKRMRRGTHSCTECRQRKVKCEFPSGATRCLSCNHYDTRCIDQRNVVDTADIEEDIPARHRRGYTESLRRRSPRTATRTPPQDIDPRDDGSQEWLGSITDTGAPGSGGSADQRAPFVSLLENADTSYRVNSAPVAERTIYTPQNLVIHSYGDYENPNIRDAQLRFRISGPTPRSRNKKAQGVCETLRSAMPSFDAMMAVLNKNGAWWNSFRQKTHAISQTPFEDLNVFAARAYTSSHPAVLGTLVTAYARCLDQDSDLYELVDLLVTSDFTYAATTEGMECIILLAKSYTDIGQPRRAWLTWRQGLTIAQLMGLYREDVSPAKRMLWWAVYHGDRFTSLLLGLPHGFNDRYYDSTLDAMAGQPESREHMFVLRCAVLAGQVIDRNVMAGAPSFAKTMDLYENMDTISSSMPKDWWRVPKELPRTESELDSLRDRILQQFYFFHVQTYLFLPFLATTVATPTRNVAKDACEGPCREMLKRFLLLRVDNQGAPLFECKTSDFVAFTAAVIFLLTRSVSTADDDHSREKAVEDLSLIMSTKEIFAREERRKGCTMSAQCDATLDLLLQTRDEPRTTNIIRKSGDISIPFFGALVRKATIPPPAHPAPSHPVQNSSEPSSQALASADSVTVSWGDIGLLPAFEYAGYNLPNAIPLADAQTVDLGGYGPSEGDPLSWLDAATMDLGQDWSTFTNFGE